MCSTGNYCSTNPSGYNFINAVTYSYPNVAEYSDTDANTRHTGYCLS